MRTDPFNASWEAWSQKWFGWFLAAAVLINFGGLGVTILEPDGALYASIARAMARTGDLIDLRAENMDWLDKPHFPFWMAALSMRIFGINGVAYKFPALLFWAAGGFYTYRLALSLYGRSVARLALLIYGSAAHLVISNNDVRAEPYLTGLVIGSVYYFYKASRVPAAKGSLFAVWGGWYLFAGSLLAACAVMTKGPFVLVTIGSGFVIDRVLAKDWPQLLHPRWWIAILLVAIFILPELYCLYVQFDLRPEKMIFGRTGVSGIRWFFWDSQFGRFFNTGPIRGSGDPLFYLHTLLWAFLPWSLLLYAAIFERCRNWERHRRAAIYGDAIPIAAAVVSFIMFSLSRFQLPHYLNILFPFFAILTAVWLHDLYKRRVVRIVVIVQNGIALLLAVLPVVLCWWFHFPGYAVILVILVVLAMAIFLLYRTGSPGREREGLMVAISRSFCMALLAYAFINFCLYPAILRYQAGSEAAEYLKTIDAQAGKKGATPAAPVYMLREASIDYSFEFYCPSPIKWIWMDSLRQRQTPVLIFLPSSYKDSLSDRGYPIQELRRFANFHVSQLNGKFLNYRTREATLDSFSLVRMDR